MRPQIAIGFFALTIAVAALALGQIQTGSNGNPDGRSNASDDPEIGSSSTRAQPVGPSALEDMFHADFPRPLVDPTQIIQGGPPPDGIPPIDDPQFVDVESADEWLATHEPVVYVQVGEDVRAYPVQILMWHEIVNDTVGGIPITVTYCPLCNSAVSFRREVSGSVTTFGTSGRLYASALVMYDRATESLWTHFDGRAVVGILAGEELEPFPSPLLGWTDFKLAFPDARVLDRTATGHDMPYGENPYPRYDNPASTPLNFDEDLDTRAEAKQRVVGVEIGGVAKAWALESRCDFRPRGAGYQRRNR